MVISSCWRTLLTPNPLVSTVTFKRVFVNGPNRSQECLNTKRWVLSVTASQVQLELKNMSKHSCITGFVVTFNKRNCAYAALDSRQVHVYSGTSRAQVETTGSGSLLHMAGHNQMESNCAKVFWVEPKNQPPNIQIAKQRNTSFPNLINQQTTSKVKF